MIKLIKYVNWLVLNSYLFSLKRKKCFEHFAVKILKHFELKNEEWKHRPCLEIMCRSQVMKFLVTKRLWLDQ